MRKRILVLGTILLDVFLLFTGSFFLYAGLWSYFYADPVPGLFFGIMMAGIGIFVIALGVILALLKIHGFLTSKSAGRDFTLPDNQQEARIYILYTEGHYITIP